MQLILLMKEKDFKCFRQKEVFKKLTEDLKDFERDGISIKM